MPALPQPEKQGVVGSGTHWVLAQLMPEVVPHKCCNCLLVGVATVFTLESGVFVKVVPKVVTPEAVATVLEVNELHGLRPNCCLCLLGVNFQLSLQQECPSSGASSVICITQEYVQQNDNIHGGKSGQLPVLAACQRILLYVA